MKRGPAGTLALNRRLQQLLNPNARHNEKADAPRVFVGDRVIGLVNDYDEGVFNGDPGIVERVLPGGGFVVNFTHGHDPRCAHGTFRHAFGTLREVLPGCFNVFFSTCKFFLFFQCARMHADLEDNLSYLQCTA